MTATLVLLGAVSIIAMAYASIPSRDPAVKIAATDVKHPLAGKLPKLVLGTNLLNWLSGLRAQVDLKPTRVSKVTLTAQQAAIGTTALPVDVTSGLYRISTAVRVTRPGSISGSVQVTIAWVDRGVTQSESGTNLVGNTTTTREGKVLVIRADANTPISYATAYADGGGANKMQYSLDVAAELQAEDAA